MQLSVVLPARVTSAEGEKGSFDTWAMNAATNERCSPDVFGLEMH